MKLLADTSVLIAASCTGHPRFVSAAPWLTRSAEGEHELHIAQHSLAEMYHVLTVLPITPRITPREARALIDEGILPLSKVVSLSAGDYKSTYRRLADLGIGGGAIFDALIARAAEKANVERLLTYNVGHFERVWPEGADIISLP